MSIDSLKQFGDEWKTPLTVRDPRGKEKDEQNSSFTKVTIKKLNYSLHEQSEELSRIRHKLAHIYYYYIERGYQIYFQKHLLKKNETIENEVKKNR